MEFRIEKVINPNIGTYHKEELDIAYKFTKDLHKEFGEFLKAVAIFGSVTRKNNNAGDIDILIVVDDVSTKLSVELIEAFKVITEKLVLKHSKRLHITTLRLTSFWDHIRSGDPIGINILRDGVAIIDTGFFNPLQGLLRQGRIRPTQESIWTYFARAPSTLNNSKWHLLQATLDLYWAVIDASHAALMTVGEIPPTPAHVSDMMEEKLVKKNLLEREYVETMREFYKLSRMILHREIKEVSGPEYNKYYTQAKQFVDRMQSFINLKRK